MRLPALPRLSVRFSKQLLPTLALCLAAPVWSANPPASALTTSPDAVVNGTQEVMIENANSASSAHRRLHTLFDAYWEEQLRNAPLMASLLGDKRYNRQLDDVSDAAHQARLQQAQHWLQQLQAFDAARLSEPDRLSLQVLRRTLETRLADGKFQSWLMPLNQLSGPHLEYAQLGGQLDFSSAQDYDDYLLRLQALPKAFEAITANMRQGMRQGLMPPRFLLEKVAEQCRNLAAQQAADSPFALPLGKFPDSIDTTNRERIRQQLLSTITQQVLPAYRKLGQFVQQEYAPHGRLEAGIWSLPQGAERYAQRVRNVSSSNLTPEEVHQTGLREVARIEAEMLQVARKLGYADVASFNRAIASKPELMAKSREDILQRYRDYTAAIYPKLGQLFGRMPKAQLEIVATEAFREKGAPGAQYESGPEDRSRAAHVVINTGDFARRSLLQIESTALHEGVPGHHFQIALAQEMEDMPTFRRHGHYGAYIEGWALYAESLGREVGAYQDPYSYYGHLQAEMMRAIRLVVDSGLHYKKWTRQQVVDFFRAHSAIDDVNIQAETDRYIAWPGQALSYKLGQLQISSLRQEAESALGKGFDLRAFHDTLLGQGALPLDLLQVQMRTWIARQKVLASTRAASTGTAATATSQVQ